MAVERAIHMQQVPAHAPPPGLLQNAESDYQEVSPDAHVIAKNIVQSKGRKNSAAPTQADLATAISNIQLNGSMKQIGNLVVTISDPQWNFLNSGFFDTDENSQIDPIDLNYPQGSRFWWRNTQVSPKGADRTIDLTFLVREAVYLMHLKGPISADRAKMTRAEFLKMLSQKQTEGKIEFYSRQLDVKQPIAPAQTTTSSASNAPAGQATKSGGLGANLSGITVKGQRPSPSQISIINTAIAVGEKQGAPANALIACIYAAMGESDVSDEAGGGVWQDLSSPNPHDIAAEAEAFFTGRFGFQAGGAIACARRGDPPWMIANEVEANLVWNTSRGDSYARQWAGTGTNGIREATDIVKAAGGGSLSAVGGGGSVSVAEPYLFQINPGELYWDGMLRLAQEVNSELFWDGNRLYYDSEQALIGQKVAVQIHREDAWVLDWSYDWDTRQICTQMTLVLLDQMNQFRAGEAFHLDGFGPGTSGSSAKPPRPGVWLVQDYQRNKSDLFTTYTLVQPDLPKLEPAPQIKTVSATASGSGSVVGGTVKARVVDAAKKAVARQAAQHAYEYAAIRPYPGDLFGPAPVRTDCSGFAILCYKTAGGPDPNGTGFDGSGSTFSMEPRGHQVALQQAEPGDLVFYPDHVAVYLGGNQIANMGSPGEPVQESVFAPHGGNITSVRQYV